MLLEVQVLGSAEWFDEVYPKFKTMGFEEIAELAWADPETDGEFTGHYFEYKAKEAIPFEHFHDFLKDMEEIILGGEAPYIKINIVPDEK
jgi:hypothetical protein